MEKCYTVCYNIQCFLYTVHEFHIWGQQSNLQTAMCWKMLYVELLVNIIDFVLFSCIPYITYIY